MTSPLREEFEKTFEDEFGYSLEICLKTGEDVDCEAVLWAARWAFKHAAESISGNGYKSNRELLYQKAFELK